MSIPAITERVNNWLRLCSPFLWAGIAVWTLQTFNPIQWWHPHCQIDLGIQEWPAQGFPLPYIQGSPVFSVKWDYMPLVMAIDYAATTILVLPITLLLTRRARERQSLPATLQAWSSLTVFSLLTVLEISFLLQACHTVKNIAQEGESYFQYRPTLAWNFYDSGVGALFCFNPDRGPRISAP